YVGGRAVVASGQLVTGDIDGILSRHAAAARRIQQC
ncbi:MAG: hypothetical protein QOK14_251, partial [Frankiaceae bacterium]|nr:hypothetical protein [Frankiaceae bacterium]